MSQCRYTVQHHNINSKFSARLSHVNVYHINQPDMDVYPGYPYTKIIYIEGGNAVINIDGQDLSLKTHDILLLNPGNPRYTMNTEREPVDLISLGVENLTFPEISPYGQVLSPTDEKTESRFTQICQFIIDEVKNPAEDYDVVCSSYLRIFLILLKRIFGINYSNVIREKRGRDCSVVKDYLDNNYKKNITLDMLSAESGMNKYYLVHSFTKLYGCSPISYLNNKRIEASKKLLGSTDMSIAEIAAELGFSSQSYFSQSFKKNTLMTPNDYRRSSRLI